MSSARDWLSRRRELLDRLPSLEDALLGGGALRYTVYRLKYVGVRALLRTLFRLAELVLFASSFSFEVLGPILMIRSVMLVGEGLWWGALETLRRDVRALHASGQSPVSVIRQWLALACCLALVIVLASLAFIPWGPSPFEGFDVVDVFVLGCGLRWALDLCVRTYHSGVYALRRVYRPVWSLLLVDVADVGVLVSAYWFLGAWGLGLSVALVGVLRASLTAAFVRRAYVQSRLFLGPPRWWFRRLSGARWSPKHSLVSALGNAVAQVDALLVLGLLAAPADASGSLLIAALFHGVSPLQTAAFSWSRLFYFDFKRLEGWGSPFLLRRFETLLGRVALWLPVPIGLVTLALLALFWNGPFWLLSLELGALAAVRSRLSLVHIRAYSLSDHAFLSKLFGGMLLVVLLTPWLGTLPADVSVGAVAGLAGLGLWVLGKSRRSLSSSSLGPELGLSAWLQRLLEHRGPTRLGVVGVDRRLTSLGKLIRTLQPELTGACITRLTRDAFAWFAPAPAALLPERVVTLGGGAVRESPVADVAPGGLQALRAGVPSSVWQAELGRYLEPAVAEDIDAAWLCRSLVELAPQALCVDCAAGLGNLAVEGCSPREVRRLMLNAARGRPGFLRLGSLEVAVLAPSGEPRLLVLVPPGPGNSATWRADAAKLLRRAEVVMTLASVGAHSGSWHTDSSKKPADGTPRP